MGYLAQKKKNIREEMVLKVLAIVLFMVTAVPVLLRDFLSLENVLFHVYCITIIALSFSVFIRRFAYSLIFLVILLVNYFYISSSTILFFSSQDQSENMISVQYSGDKLNIKNAEVLQKGFLGLDSIYAPFSRIKTANTEQVFIGVNFSKLQNTQKALHQLRNFVINQDNPVVIIGDFSLPAWSSPIKKFLVDTNLEVKNRLLFISSKNKNAFFSAPSFNILSFHKTVVSDIKIIESKQKFPIIEFNFGLLEN